MKHTREIEQKFKLLTARSLDWCWSRLLEISELAPTRVLNTCTTKDTYYAPPLGVDIVRLRDSYGVDGDGYSKQLKEITVKVVDKGSNFDRIEENICIQESQSAFRSLKLLLGEPLFTIRKEERVLWTRDNTTISLALVNNKYVYLEIEAGTEAQVHYWTQHLLDHYVPMEFERRSLFEIYNAEIC